MASKIFLTYFILILLLSHFIFFSFYLLIICLDGINGIANFCYFSLSFALFEGLSHTNAVLIAAGAGVE
jgi:hypothetical protein